MQTELKKSLFEDTPVFASMSPDRAIEVLNFMNETDIAQVLENKLSANNKPLKTFGIMDMFSSNTIKPWMHAAHAFGFLPAKSNGDNSILSAGRVIPDETLKNSRIRISLNRLRVAAYPGGGRHTILFNFSAQNQIPGGIEDINFNSSFRIEDGSQAGVIGYPIFIGLGVGIEGVFFKCYTVNVKNDDDEKLISALESSVFKKGLKLVTTVQPALTSLSDLAIGLTKSIASRHRNVPVQDFFMGLDFGGTRMGARLAQGDYIAVQIPMDLQRVWKWEDWIYDDEAGQILSKKDGSNIPFNYIVFGVSKYEGS